MRTMKQNVAILVFAFMAAALLGSVPLAEANDKIEIELVGFGPVVGPDVTGKVEIKNDPTEPDRLKLKIEGLPPNTRHTVFLTKHRLPSRLPAQFIGEFTTNRRGTGQLTVTAEIVNAFASANQAAEDANGEADVGGAGTVPAGGGTANTISLNWYRGYFVDLMPHNVFGPDENTLGGPPSFISEVGQPLP